jgi:hypothetical protein
VVFPVIRADILRVANVFFRGKMRVTSKMSGRITGKTSNKLFIIRL